MDASHRLSRFGRAALLKQENMLVVPAAFSPLK
jgi:hypothetical protein